MQQDSPTQLSLLSIIFHWSISVTFICLLCVGIYMADNEIYSLYPIHKSIGILILLLVVPRILWRLKNGFPAPLYDNTTQKKLATAAHVLLLIATLLMPISGMMMSGFAGHGLAVFGLELAAANPDPLNPGQVIAINSSLAGLGHEVHEIAKNIIILIILVHIAGALKHHFMDKDGTLRRMLGRKV